ncbi:Thioredoxin [uncultured archaeon]|nr:Thioredoxin [uncultured archaeon]
MNETSDSSGGSTPSSGGAGGAKSPTHAAKPAGPGQGYYAIGLALVVGLVILLGTVWLANQNFNTAVSQYPPAGNGSMAPNNPAPNTGSNNAASGGTGTNSGSGTNNPSAPLPTIDLSTRPVRGSPNAPVTIFEIADFQCPYCVQAYPTVEQVMAKYNGSVKLIFVHFPLTSIHPLAQKAAEAAECANDQGKFWEMYDSLFTTNKLEVSDLKAQAKTLGLDTAKFNTCLDSGAKAPLIQAFSNLATQNGISSTPTFIVNGQELQDRSLAGFSTAIDNVLNPPRAVINVTGRPTRGNASAPLQIVEFSDFECPYCEMAYGVVKQAEKDYGSQMSLTYMEFPLSIHPDAQKAAEAAECAYRQKPAAFWSYYDWMFTNRSLDVPSLKGYAGEIGLNTTQFNACLDGGQAAAQVSADEAQGGANGVQGTPGFFINGLPIRGYLPYEQFKAVLDRELARAKNGTAAS